MYSPFKKSETKIDQIFKTKRRLKLKLNQHLS